MSRNVFGIHTDINGMKTGLISHSALVKVLFEPQDAHVVHGWRYLTSPYTYWLYRSPKDLDDPVNPGELQRRYKAAQTKEQAQDVGAWYADWLASWVIPAGMQYMFLEGGPNEQNDTTLKAVWYSEAFTRRCLAHGLKPAPGMYSFGLPKVTKYDGFDGWAMWQPVFDAIDQANAGKQEPVAGFQLHEYAMAGDMLASIDHAIGRYQFMPYRGPIFLGEFGYADYNKPPTTEIMIKQITDINERLGRDDRLCGFAWYDIRNHTDHKYDYCYDDIERALAAQNLPTLPIVVRTSPIIEVPPDPQPEPEPEPPSNTVSVLTTYAGGQNLRKYPSLKAALVGGLDYGKIGYVDNDQAVSIGVESAWVYVKLADGQEGWAAAWLLKSK